MATKESSAAEGAGRGRWRRFKAWMAARLAWAWQPLLYIGILLGFLMGRAIPISPVATFGIAFYVAVRIAGFGGLAGLPVAAAVIGGAATVRSPLALGTVALAIGLAHLAAGIFKVREGLRPLAAALLASAVAAAQGLVQVPPVETIQLVFWASLTGVLSLIFTLAVGDLTRGRNLWGGSSDLPIPSIILLASALTGLQDLVVYDQISLHGLAAGLAVMLCAQAGGLGWGAAAGAVIGISSFFTVLANPIPSGLGSLLPEGETMAYVIAGFLAGAFRDLKKPGVGLAYALGFLSYSMATQGQGAVLEAMAFSAVAATGLFWLLPSGWFAGLTQALQVDARERAASREVKDEAVVGTLERLRSMSQVLKEVHRTYHQVAAVGAPPDLAASRPFEPAIDRVCHTCALYSECWQKNAESTAQLFASLWERIEQGGPLPAVPAPDDLEQECMHPEQVAVTLNHLFDLQRSDRALGRRLEEGRAIAGEYIQNVARLLDRMAEEVEQTGGKRPAGGTIVFKANAAVARLPKRGGHISGDSVEIGPLSQGRYLMAVSDGMGVGREAAVQSRQSVRLLHQLLDAGFTADVAVQTVNSVLLLKGPNDTFATVDAAILDLVTGRAEFVKVGAAPSFFKRGHDVTVIKVPSVPVGIINEVEVEPEYRNLRDGDMIIMVTDGIWEAAKQEMDKERWLLDFLAREQTDDPEELAERVLARALTIAPDPDAAPEDDLTVVVARVSHAEGSAQESQPRQVRTGEWAPVQVAPRMKPVKKSGKES